ncbi:MAG: hypothetical protein SGPRY_012875, partial [Prymnesium sp.]
GSVRLKVVFSRDSGVGCCSGHLLQVIPGFWGLAGAMWALFALYAQLGVSLFGGLVTVDYWDPSDPMALYAYCNFNDFGSAVLTLFNLLVVNNWHDIMDVIVDLTSSWSIIYFISWYILAVVIMFNLVIAHILDGYFDGSHALGHALMVQGGEGDWERHDDPHPTTSTRPMLNPLPNLPQTNQGNSFVMSRQEALWIAL